MFTICLKKRKVAKEKGRKVKWYRREERWDGGEVAGGEGKKGNTRDMCEYACIYERQGRREAERERGKKWVGRKDSIQE